MQKTGILDLPDDFMDKTFRAISLHSDQRSLPAIQSYAMASKDTRGTVHASSHAYLMDSIKAYLETPPVENVYAMAHTSPLIPMYVLIHHRAYSEIIARVKAYRLSPLVILRTLKFFTASFDVQVGDPHVPRYFDNLHLPEKSMSNAEACVFLMDAGFLDFVAGVMQDYDRNTEVVSACIRFLYSITAVMKIVHEQILPYSWIIQLIQNEHDAGGILWGYNNIMLDWKKKHVPPESRVQVTVDLLNAAQLHVNSRIIARGPQHRQDDISIAAHKIVCEANTCIIKITCIASKTIELSVRNVVQWLKVSLANDNVDDLSDQVLALAFLSRLCDLDRDANQSVLMEHGIAEVLVTGIHRNNRRAEEFKSIESVHEEIVTKTQLAYYTLMTTLLKTADVEPTISKFQQQEAMQPVMETLRLSIVRYKTIFSFYQNGKPYRPNFPNTIIPGVERAPYKTRCDGVTPTYSVPELAIIVACQLCFGDHISVQSPVLPPMLSDHFNLLKTFNIPEEPSRTLESVLVIAHSTLRDTDDVLFIPYHIEAMDDESFRMRQDSKDTVEYMIRKNRNQHATRNHW